MSLLGCLVITEGYSVAYLLPPIYRKKVTLSAAGGRILLSETTIAALEGDLTNYVMEKGDMQLKRRRKTVKVYEFNSLA